MSWTEPKTMTSEPGTSADWNTYVRDNLNDLDRRTAITRQLIEASESTTSTSFTNLATSGPTVSCTVGDNGVVMVTLSCSILSGANVGGLMGFAVSGPTTVAADPGYSIGMQVASGTAAFRLGSVFVVSHLNPGTTTFTAKYCSLSGGTVTFEDRAISALPLSA